MSDFQFLRPLALLAFIPFFAFIFWRLRNSGRTSIWTQACSKDLLPYILANKGTRQWLPYLLILATGVLLITALAGPSWQMLSEPLLKTQSGLVIALDLSNGMNAQDIKPSRVQRAIYKITDLLALRREGQTALVVFSEDPYIVTPLTDDTAAIQALLPALDTRIMPSSGHQADKAIAKAAEMFKQAGIANGAVLLMTSSLSKQEMERSLEHAAREGLSISVLGIGTEEGAPLPKQEGGFSQDEKGALIVSMLSKENLSHLAKSAHGSFATISLDGSDLAYLSKKFNSGASAREDDQTAGSRPHDQGYLLVLLALPLAALCFRRGMLVAALFLLPHGLQALSWDDLWKTPDQQAEQFYHQKEYQKAESLFHDLDWKAAANYQLGEYEQAAEYYQSNHSADGLYNYGTAKAKQGDFEAALEAYGKALEMQPDHEDALYNKKLIEELKQQQQQQSQKDQNDQNQEKSDQQQQDQGQDQAKQEEGSQEKGQEQQDKESKKEEQQERQKEAESQDEKETEELREQFKEEMDKKLQENQEKQPEPVAQEDDISEEDQQRQVDDRWLQKVKDDPGGLLRRKFLMQYRQQNRKQ